MQKSFITKDRRSLLFSLLFLGLVAALIFVPAQFISQAGGNGNAKKGLVQQTSSQDEGIVKMYDIREDKTQLDNLADFRSRVGKNAVDVADQREKFVRGEEYLKSQLPTAKVDYNLDIRIPELITPDVYAAKVQWLTQPSTAKRADILRNFVKEHNLLIGLDNQQVDGLKNVADYTNPDGNLSYVHLEQRINGIPVFRGEVKAGFTRNNEVIRVINNLAPGLDYNSLSTEFGNPVDAVGKAAGHINHELRPADTSRNDAASNDLKVVFGEGDWATTAEKMYFPTEPGVAVPSWRILIWRPINAYYVIVDAQTGIVLWHKNIADDQTQSATYNVYTNPTSPMNAADHAAPLSPYISVPANDPTVGAQGSLITRNNVSLIGNEAPNTFNNNGWINDSANVTDGNSNEAGIDRDGANGVDAPLAGDTACPGAGCRVFTSTWNPPPGMPAPGDDPLTPQAQRGAVIQMFYLMNRYHDILYQAGFTEAALNFQGTNFTGMGIGNDRVSSEGQDSSGTNNANFATPADGGRGRMQMYLWTGPTPDRDGTADADIVIHEVTHGTSNRLHGNGSGLGNQGGMMGEGWGDWYAHTMLATPTDNVGGIYGLGGYSLLNLGAGFNANYYYGIRRFPTALIATTGGPNNRPHNPLTFGHLNVGCDTALGTTTTAVSSAYPRSPVIATSGNCSQVHNAGEIWKSALWEVRSLFLANRGFTDGTRAVLQVVTDGMKLTQVNPNMLQERNGIIAAALALSASPENSADAAAVREGFRRRGFGFSATVESATAVTEAFDAPTVGGGAASVTSGNNLLEPNECNTLNVLLNNNSNDAATGVSAVLSSNTPGITVTQANSAYPNLAAGAQGIANTTPYQVSVDNTVACFTQASFTLTVTYAGGGGGSPLTFNFSLPVGIPGNAYTFTAGTGTIPAGGTLVAGSQADDAAVAITLPAGWVSSVYDVAVTSLSASTNGAITVNAAAATAFTNTALPATFGATPTLFPLWDDMDMDVADSGAGGGIYTQATGTAPNRQFIIEWRGQHFAETVNNVITVNFAVVLTEGTGNIRYVYTSTGIAPNANGVSATTGVQRAATGTQFTQISFNTATVMPGTDQTGTLPAGQCTPGSGPCGGPVVPENPRADFDGDGKTDLSVYRPSEGNWYLQRSTAGFGVINWGNATDTLIPGDYDGDGKADTAVFRPSADPAVNDYFVLRSNGFTFQGTSWGVPNDIPVTGDYNGDNRDDLAVFRPSNGTWYILNSVSNTNTVAPFGLSSDIPLAIDNDGDGRTNLAVYRPSNNTWYIAKPSGTPATNFDAFPYGATGDRQVQADYDGDAKDDIAVFRPSNGTWYIRRSTNGNTDVVPFGAAADIAVPGDYDGDGKDDVAVYRGGTWYVNRSTGGLLVQAFGLGTDTPIPVRYLPGGGGGVVTPTPGSLQFSAATYTVGEAGPTATITVTRTGGSDGVVGATYATSNGTATGGAACGGAVDFVNANGTVSFGAGVTTPQTFTVAICDDTTVETSETVNVALSAATGGATLGTPAAAVLTITDNDGGGGGVTASYTGPAVVIPDNVPAGVNINVPVTGAGTVSDLNFRFDTLSGATCDGTVGDTDCSINHSWIGDVIVKITPPDGSPTVTIFDRPGVPGTTVGCNNNNIGDILLNDEGGFPSVDIQGNPTPTACNTALLFPIGNFSPINPLSALDGETVAGTWVINVSDSAGLDTGSVQRFSLVFNSGN